ncbi:N-acetylglucosamine kinase [Streptomyces sp. NPDC047928]|uniref:N-acetylglucosamine kinase n=1 Tax=unclassified Streptomyces TaxID=2593676 RepID=UPI003714FEC0
MTTGPAESRRRVRVLGVDSGGSGLRVALATAGQVPGGRRPGGDTGAPVPETLGSVAFDGAVPTGPGGIDAKALLDLLVPAAERLLADAGAQDAGAQDSGAQDAGTADAGAERSGAGHGGAAHLDAVAVGAAGMTSLGDDLRGVLPGELARRLGVRRLALAADAVTAYAGALGQCPGAVVAAGTGLIALGTDLSRWRRADGWGHLLGDCGSGAWIGRAGLDAALRAHDGRRGGSTALLARAEALFGPVSGLPGQLYPRTDRPAVLASFAPEVARCADRDPVSAEILARAARHIAEAAVAVHPKSGDAGRVALTGGLLKLGEPLLVPLRAEFERQLPYGRPVSAAGDPLSGALVVAAALATDTLRLPIEPGMLDVYRG